MFLFRNVVEELKAEHEREIKRGQADYDSKIRKMEDDHAAEVRMLRERADNIGRRSALDIEEAVNKVRSTILKYYGGLHDEKPKGR